MRRGTLSVCGREGSVSQKAGAAESHLKQRRRRLVRTTDVLCKYQPHNSQSMLRSDAAHAGQITGKQAQLKGVAGVSNLSQQAKRLRPFNAHRVAACNFAP